MSKWIGSREMHGNAHVFGQYYAGSIKEKHNKIKHKKLNKNK